jgi:thiopurine S-methyltransferase
MDKKFWLEKWDKSEIGFHEKKGNQFLVEFFSELNLKKGDTIFIPLCGKTRDIAWLLSNKYHIIGAELAEIAIIQLFAELELKPQIVELDKFKQYSAKNIDIYVGDIFELTCEMLEAVDAVYDRAALVALPEKNRKKYTSHLMKITNKAPQLLITFEYNQEEMEGPPFSINSEEVNRHYAGSFQLKLLKSSNLRGGIRGKYPANESVWLIT